MNTSGHPMVRRVLRGLAIPTVRALTRLEIRGREHIPKSGPLILAGNHVGFLDPILVGMMVPFGVEPLTLSDLLRVPGTGLLLRLWGIIPVHRGSGESDVLALAMDALAQGKIVGILPEGRMSVTGGLERARPGVAFLALSSGLPIVPTAVTGTEHMFAEWKRARRPRLTLTFGAPFVFNKEPVVGPGRHDRLRQVSDEIMYRIAEMLPPSYRGVYATVPPMPPPARHPRTNPAAVTA